MSPSGRKPKRDADAFSWGVLPEDAVRLIEKREWDNSARLKKRLLGELPFPLKLSLKPPGGRHAVSNLSHFQRFVESWRNYPHQDLVEWEERSYRSISNQRVPRYLIVDRIDDLIRVIGAKARQRASIWERHMTPLLALPGVTIYPVLVKHLLIIEALSLEGCELMAQLIPQLKPFMGGGCYLRALPLKGVDTKFLESHQVVIADLLDAIYDGRLTDQGGLLPFLGCVENPKGWLYVRPLCESAKERMGGFTILRLPIVELIEKPLPASNILVVENVQSGLGLPDLEDTIAVFGGGKNVSWMSASWLKGKKVAYWGDIDTWGLFILSDVRKICPLVTPLMMDMKTLCAFEARMAHEPSPVEDCPPFLNEEEKKIFFGLKKGAFNSSRLEQERLSSDYIYQVLTDFVGS